MIYLIWVLRLIHIIGGVFWVGGALIMNFFVGPTIGATGEAGQKFAGYLMGKAGISQSLMGAGIATVLAGATLYWIDSHGFTSAWWTSSVGLGFLTGAIFALIGLVAGIMVGQNLKSLVQLGAQIQGKPTPEQLQKIQAIQKKQAVVGNINVYGLILAVVFMAVSRYLVF